MAMRHAIIKIFDYLSCESRVWNPVKFPRIWGMAGSFTLFTYHLHDQDHNGHGQNDFTHDEIAFYLNRIIWISQKTCPMYCLNL